jgi:hypothetical protein
MGLADAFASNCVLVHIDLAITRLHCIHVSQAASARVLYRLQKI